MPAPERDRLAKALSAFATAAGELSDDNVLTLGWHSFPAKMSFALPQRLRVAWF